MYEFMKWYHYLILLLIMYFFCECRTEYVPLEVVKRDSVIIASLDRDSIFVRDSVFVREKGDTVYKYKDKYVYVYKNLVDTFTVYRDREVEVPVPVERKLSWWERMKMEYAEWVIGVLMGIVLLLMLRQWMARRVSRKEKRVS